jgi:two-component system, OmpR family, response regulator MtrA
MPAAPHILIAHDHDLVRTLLVQLVAQIYPSATITAVTNGAEALNAYRQYGADLVITNDRMAGMRGVNLVMALRADQAPCPIPMVSSDDTLEAAVLMMGANHFLCAPFGLEDLRQALTSLLPL